MTDIVERLRKATVAVEDLIMDAADEIERLGTINAKMLEALTMANEEFEHIGRRCLASDVVNDAIEKATKP